MNTINSTKKIKVAVGLSGGVDSSVSALLLKQQGFDVVGVHMQCWDYDLAYCTGKQDKADAVALAAQLNIKFEFLDYQAQYKSKVIEYFYSEYEQGRTPNPDIMCNKEIKFGLFLTWALENGFDYIATGHYAISKNGQLFKGVDATKDQSYFLYALNSLQLQKVLFPVGHLLKSQVRQIALENNILVSQKPDSTGICFIGEVNIKEFLKERLPVKKGPVILNDTIIGEHDGIWFYTIGQRHGFKINKYIGLPLYVIKKDAALNHLIVGFSSQGKTNEFNLTNISFITTPTMNLDNTFNCDIRIRHLGQLYSGVVNYNKVENTAKVTLKDLIFGVASGQSAVFYKQDLCLGGGIIV